MGFSCNNKTVAFVCVTALSTQNIVKHEITGLKYSLTAFKLDVKIWDVGTTDFYRKMNFFIPIRMQKILQTDSQVPNVENSFTNG